MFQIPKLNKTILVNNCYGEATFIYDGILEYNDVVAYSKKDLSSQLTKIIFSHSKKEAWDVQILGELTRIKQEVKEKREKGELSEPKSVKEIFKANREAISNEKKREEITKFFLKNYGTKIKITKENEKDYTFPEEESKGLNIFTGEKNEQLYIFTEGEERNVYTFTEEDKEKLVIITKEERKDLKITVWEESQGLRAIARTFWLKEGDPRSNPKDRVKLLSEIIKGGIKSKEEITDTLNEEIRKETIKYFNEHYATKKIENWKVIYVFTEEDKEKLIMMETRERKDLKITVWGKPQGLFTIATAFWLKEENPAVNQEDREKFLSEIIKGEIKSRKEIFKTKFIECLENKFGKNIGSFTDEDKETLVMMTVEERNKAFEITVWGESQSLDKIATAFWLEKEKPNRYQEGREKLLSEIIWEKIKSKKELIKKYFTKDFPTAKEAKEKLSAMIEYKRKDYKISIQGRKLGLRGMTKDFWIEGDPVKDLEVLEKLIDTIWTYEPPEENSLSLAKDSLQAHHCELNEETLVEKVNSTNTDEGAKVLQ